ncbi:MAG: ATP-binding protein [Rhodospirillaceae bacterium]|nr:ATP-binding protein [Rhodospirillaceae bacterium]MDD9998562.1 ATP-binding protein [Rhodospirillaceae bacterium]
MFDRLLQTTRSNSFFLFGARGTGKTTYIRHAFDPDTSLYVDLLDPEIEDAYRRTPHRLEHQVLALPDAVEWVLIDEVQRAPRLLDVVHRLIESTGKRFVLTGSSGRKLRRGASNLLAGRAFVYDLYPLTVPELGDSFDLDDTLRWGTLPRIYSLRENEDKQAYLRAYALTYLKEEIVAEQIVRRLDPFRQFLEVAAQSNGTIINYANIARDVGVDPKTVISYFSILEDTLVGFLLSAYHRSVRKQQRANPKFYFFDTGVKRSLDRTLQIPLNERTYEYGKAFEHFIITQIAHMSRYRYPDWRLSYLRTGAGAEIDLVIERPGQPEAIIEIKSSQRVDDRDVRGLARFTGDFANAAALCISRDRTRMRMDGVLCLHWRDALAELGLT